MVAASYNEKIQQNVLVEKIKLKIDAPTRQANKSTFKRYIIQGVSVEWIRKFIEKKNASLKLRENCCYPTIIITWNAFAMFLIFMMSCINKLKWYSTEDATNLNSNTQNHQRSKRKRWNNIRLCQSIFKRCTNELPLTMGGPIIVKLKCR